MRRREFRLVIAPMLGSVVFASAGVADRAPRRTSATVPNESIFCARVAVESVTKVNRDGNEPLQPSPVESREDRRHGWHGGH